MARAPVRIDGRWNDRIIDPVGASAGSRGAGDVGLAQFLGRPHLLFAPEVVSSELSGTDRAYAPPDACRQSHGRQSHLRSAAGSASNPAADFVQGSAW